MERESMAKKKRTPSKKEDDAADSLAGGASFIRIKFNSLLIAA